MTKITDSNDNTLPKLIKNVIRWVKTGKINPKILTKDFKFSSPFWKNMNSTKFLEVFSDTKTYFDKSLQNIVQFRDVITCISPDKRYFTIAFKYRTKNNTVVDEVILCRVQGKRIFSIQTIYDLNTTKRAHNLK